MKAELVIQAQQGYSAEDIDGSITLGDLLESVRSAIETMGEDAIVVLRDENNRYGASFGRISPWNSILPVEDVED